ncbi:MAG: hypothetical protein ACRCXB_09720 [Aeromonadaceae bacterium]
MPHTKPPRGPENAWYPRHASIYADVLIEELSEAQCVQLYDALQSMTYAEWSIWMSEKLEAISLYDASTANARAQIRASDPGSDSLMLHYASLCSELLRLNFSQYYAMFPYRLDEAVHQREMLRAVMAADLTIDIRSYWPFEYPENADPFPFKISD